MKTLENFSISSQISTFAEMLENEGIRQYNDEVHGPIVLDNYVWEFVETPQFQRLRNLKQLGNCHFTFSNATHSRYEHSIGVAYLSNKFYNHLCEDDGADEKAVTLAGLCHDLGHGPFSHLFDRGVIRTLK
jgi:HD superfamily phosphohydrolase